MNKIYAAKASEVITARTKIVKVKDIEIGLFHIDGEFYAWRNMCPHAAAPICVGEVCGTRLPSMVYQYEYGQDQQILRCPWHGWEFDLITGAHLVDSSTKLRGYTVEVDGDNLYLLL